MIFAAQASRVESSSKSSSTRGVRTSLLAFCDSFLARKLDRGAHVPRRLVSTEFR